MRAEDLQLKYCKECLAYFDAVFIQKVLLVVFLIC
jgi:hypothetical protein